MKHAKRVRGEGVATWKAVEYCEQLYTVDFLLLIKDEELTNHSLSDESNGNNRVCECQGFIL